MLPIDGEYIIQKKLPMKSNRIFSIYVAGKHGYSFAVKCNATKEADVVQMAKNAGLFQDDEDAFYATAEDITDSEYDINGLKDCTYEI